MLRRFFLATLAVALTTSSSLLAQNAPVHIWLEPEWFPGVKGDFNYWTGKAKPLGSWGIAGPGISAEFSQGGESEWQSMGAVAEETTAACERAIVVPRAGKYRIWVRYVDHRGKTEPFTVRVEQNGQPAIAGELGVKPVAPPNDEYMLYWDFSFAWAPLDGQLAAGPAKIKLLIDKPGQAWRQVDAILLTDDLAYEPVAREKPRFAYLDAFALEPTGAGASWRGSGEGMTAAGTSLARKPLAGRDFSMWAGIGQEKAWWDKQNVDALTPYDVMMEYGFNDDIKAQFQKQFAGRRDVPLIGWPHLFPGLYLQTPDLSPGTPLRRYLERTKSPFYVITNYANPTYDDKTGPATFAALTGPLAAQFLGYIHGEAVGTVAVGRPHGQLAPTRRQHVDALVDHYRKAQIEQWKSIYKTDVPPAFRNKSIVCLSVDCISLAHAFAKDGHDILGYELDATNAHTPMRVAFHRGAARQYGKAWINYASGNFGDACNYFTQDPIVPRGAKGWWHSKYAVTDGVPVAWYRAFYYVNYLSGASAIHWEQGYRNQWMMPGPGEHPVSLSPFGRATQDFQAFVDRVSADGGRGEPYTPVALLLSHGHGYERVNNACKMLDVFPEDVNDRELNALFDVAWHPAERFANEPITPMRQSLPGNVFGNIFDVLVDRPDRLADVVKDYPVVWAAGDVELGGATATVVQDYLNRGGTLVANVQAVRGKLAETLLGVKLTGQRKTFEHWTPFGAATQPSTPYEVEVAQPAGATVLAWSGDATVPLVTRHAVGKGALILTLVPHMLGIDQRAHPVLPWLMTGVTQDLSPIDVRLAGGTRPNGDVMYQINRTEGAWLVMFINNAGIDKTQTGISRVDRRQYRHVVLSTKKPITSAKELTQPRELERSPNKVEIRVEPGDVQVVRLQLGA